MFAAICVPNFALQSLLRHEPELRERPVALIEATGTNLAKTLVIECTRAAEAAGVCAGLIAPQAQARCRELILKPRSLSAEQSATEILLQTAYAFSPIVDLGFGSIQSNLHQDQTWPHPPSLPPALLPAASCCARQLRCCWSSSSQWRAS